MHQLLARSFSRTPQLGWWSKIKDKKGANDAQKSVLYSRASHDIALAVRMGGSADPSKNIQLATALKKAKEQGVPKDNIEKALARAAGAKDKAGDTVMYEALVDDVGILIECVTDNINRTIHGIREILTLHNARMSSVKFMFEHKGCLEVMCPEDEEPEPFFNRLFDEAISCGIEDMVEMPDSDVHQLLCPPAVLGDVQKSLSQSDLDIRVKWSGLVYRPKDPANLEPEAQTKIQNLIEALKANDDTINVWSSMST